MQAVKACCLTCKYSAVCVPHGRGYLAKELIVAFANRIGFFSLDPEDGGTVQSFVACRVKSFLAKLELPCGGATPFTSVELKHWVLHNILVGRIK